MEPILTYLKSIDKQGLVAAVALLMISGGIAFMLRLNGENPLSKYSIQVVGITMVLPIVLVISSVSEIPKEAVTGFIGTILGFVFGREPSDRGKP